MINIISCYQINFKINFRNWILLLIFNWKKLKLNGKIRLGLVPIFRFDIHVSRSRARTKVQVCRVPFEPKICTTCVRLQERTFLLLVLPITKWITLYIYLLAYINFPYIHSQYVIFHFIFPIQWVYFEQQFFIHPLIILDI